MDNKKDLASIIGASLNKYEAVPGLVYLNDFQFEVIAFFDIDINKESIHQLNDGPIQFNGNSKIRIKDPKSKVTTNNEAIFSGIAFFGKDITKDCVLLHIDLYNISIKIPFSDNN